MSKVLDLTEKVKRREVLVIKLGEDEYKIPLGDGLKLEKLKELQDINKFQAFLVENGFPEDQLTVGTTRDIITAWEAATYEEAGVTPGESSASRSSSKSTARR